MVGTATAAGVYTRRELKGLMSAVQLEDPALSVGTNALLKQSSMAARLYRVNALLKAAKRPRSTKARDLIAMVFSKLRTDQLPCSEYNLQLYLLII